MVGLTKPAPPKRTSSSSFRDSSVMDGEDVETEDERMDAMVSSSGGGGGMGGPQSWEDAPSQGGGGVQTLGRTSQKSSPGSAEPTSELLQPSSQHPMQLNSPSLTSFGRGGSGSSSARSRGTAPVMGGNRGYERRYQASQQQQQLISETAHFLDAVSNNHFQLSQQQQLPQPPVTFQSHKAKKVAALEVQNVRRAINRYGTLPKNARIGAYLESLRQSGLHTPGPGTTPVYDAEEESNGDEVGTAFRLSSDDAALRCVVDFDVGASSERNLKIHRSLVSRHQSMPTEEETGSLTEERIRARDLKNKNFMIRSNSSSTGFPNDKNQVAGGGAGHAAAPPNNAVPCMVGGKLGVGRAYQSSRAALGGSRSGGAGTTPSSSSTSKTEPRRSGGGATKQATLEFPPPPPDLPPPPDDELMLLQAEAKERLSSQLSGGGGGGGAGGAVRNASLNSTTSGRVPPSPKVGSKEKPPVSPKLTNKHATAAATAAAAEAAGRQQLMERSAQQEIELHNAAGLRWNRRVQRQEDEKRTDEERFEDAMDDFDVPGGSGGGVPQVNGSARAAQNEPSSTSSLRFGVNLRRTAAENSSASAAPPPSSQAAVDDSQSVKSAESSTAAVKSFSMASRNGNVSDSPEETSMTSSRGTNGNNNNHVGGGGGGIVAGGVPAVATKRKPSQPFSASSDSLSTTGNQSLEDLDCPNGDDKKAAPAPPPPKPPSCTEEAPKKPSRAKEDEVPASGNSKEPIWLNRVNRFGRSAPVKDDAPAVAKDAPTTGHKKPTTAAPPPPPSSSSNAAPDFTRVSLRKVAPPTTKPPPPERTIVPSIFAAGTGGGVYAQPGVTTASGVPDEPGRMYEKPQVLKRFSLLKQRNEAENKNDEQPDGDGDDGQNKQRLPVVRIDPEDVNKNEAENVADDQSSDKRVSTGSISSLKKMWEKEREQKQLQQQQQQAAVVYKDPKSSSSDSAYHTSATTTPILDRKGVRRASDAKKATAAWPPPAAAAATSEAHHQPALPVQEPAGQPQDGGSKPQVPVKPSVGPKQKSPPQLSEAAETQKDEALQCCRAADKTLSSSKGQCVAGALTAASCAQMADKMRAVRDACAPLADAVPPHSRFHFREMMAALERHQQLLAASSSRGGPEARRLINDAQSTLKDLTAILNR